MTISKRKKVDPITKLKKELIDLGFSEEAIKELIGKITKEEKAKTKKLLKTIKEAIEIIKADNFNKEKFHAALTKLSQSHKIRTPTIDDFIGLSQKVQTTKRKLLNFGFDKKSAEILMKTTKKDQKFAEIKEAIDTGEIKNIFDLIKKLNIKNNSITTDLYKIAADASTKKTEYNRKMYDHLPTCKFDDDTINIFINHNVLVDVDKFKKRKDKKNAAKEIKKAIETGEIENIVKTLIKYGFNESPVGTIDIYTFRKKARAIKKDFQLNRINKMKEKLYKNGIDKETVDFFIEHNIFLNAKSKLLTAGPLTRTSTIKKAFKEIKKASDIKEMAPEKLKNLIRILKKHGFEGLDNTHIAQQKAIKIITHFSLKQSQNVKTSSKKQQKKTPPPLPKRKPHSLEGKKRRKPPKPPTSKPKL